MSVDLPTFNELYADGQAEMQSRNPGLTDFREGSNCDAIVGSGAVLADEVIEVAVSEFGKQFFDTAEGADLDALVTDRFGTNLARKAASASVGTLTFTRSASTPTGNISIAAGTTVRATVDDESVSFTTSGPAIILDGDSTADVVARCSVAGTAGNVAAGVVTEVVDSVPDDPDITVTNADRFTGGAAEQTDESLRDAIRRYYESLRRGSIEALRGGALSVAGVEYATVDESYILPADGGYVAVYVGDPDARANSALVSLVETELEDYRAAGIMVQVSATQRDEISLSVTLYVVTGANQDTIRTDAEENVRAYVNNLDAGETMRLARIQSAAIHVSEYVVGANVTSHTADLDPSANNYAIRVNSGDLVVNLVEVSA